MKAMKSTKRKKACVARNIIKKRGSED